MAPGIAKQPVLTARRIAFVGTAVLAAVLLLPTFLLLSRWWNGVPVHWVAPRGESKTLRMEDGTQVLLDADSELVTKLGARVRRASLLRGEALFAVKYDVSRPFEIEAGPGRITDLGTHFDVERLPGAVRISVYEGRVGVRTAHGEVVLETGRGGGYDDSGILLPVNPVNAATMLQADGQRRFDSEPLAAIVARFARYHPVTFVFANPELEELQVSGTFRISDLTLFLRTLSTAFPVEARWIGSQRVEFVPRQHARSRSLRGQGDNSE
jgi:transmembrane sensor